MKKFFSLFILVALFATVMLLAACEETYVPGDGPESDVVCEHKFVDKKVAKTCVKDGYTEHTCSECGYYYRDNIVSSGHTFPDKKDYVTVVSNPDSCTTVTTTMKVCKVCAYTEKVGEPQTTYSHKLVLVESVIAPTCTDAGTQLWNCEKCGKMPTEKSVPAVGHVWGEWIVDREPTCSVEHVVFGTEHRTCSECYLTEMATILPHSCACEEEGYTGEPCTVTPPTCYEVGYTTHTCKDCGVEYHRDFVESEHKYSDWEPVEGYEGLAVRECTDCGHKEYKEMK